MNKAETRNKRWYNLFAEGVAVGEAAMVACVPTPMVVEQHANSANDSSPVVKSWHVPGGVCGFAWVVVAPGTSSFARWLRTNDHAHKHYYGGVAVWVSGGGQSMEMKEAYAHAMAKVFADAGIKAYAQSRMD